MGKKFIFSNVQTGCFHWKRGRRDFCCAPDDATSVRTNQVTGSCTVHVFLFFNLAHAHFILKMAAVQGGLVDAAEEKDIKTEPASDGFGNNNANDGRLLSTSPGSSASTGSNKTVAGAPEDQQTLLAVLQFLKKNKLNESVEILRREAGLPEDSLDPKGTDASGAGSGGASGGVDLEGGDASSLLSRVTVSASAGAQAPTKGPILSLATETLSHG